MKIRLEAQGSTDLLPKLLFCLKTFYRKDRVVSWESEKFKRGRKVEGQEVGVERRKRGKLLRF